MAKTGGIIEPNKNKTEEFLVAKKCYATKEEISGRNDKPKKEET
jgi:hypothetical protein